MNDPVWCQKILHGFSDVAQRWIWSDERFSSLIEEALISWQDTAAREIHSRYIDLYCSQAAYTRQVLLCQREQLFKVVLHMNEAENPARKITQLSEESADLRIQVDSNIKSAHSYVDEAFNMIDEAVKLRQDAKAILDSI